MVDITLLFWHWWIIAVVLFIAELLLTANVFLWMGISAVCMGFISYVIPSLSVNTAYIIFAALSLISAIGYRIWQTKIVKSVQESALNNPSRKYIGQIITLNNPIKNGIGREKIGHSIWTINGPDLKSGSKVKITKSDSTTFTVETI